MNVTDECTDDRVQLYSVAILWVRQGTLLGAKFKGKQAALCSYQLSMQTCCGWNSRIVVSFCIS